MDILNTLEKSGDLTEIACIKCGGSGLNGDQGCPVCKKWGKVYILTFNGKDALVNKMGALYPKPDFNRDIGRIRDRLIEGAKEIFDDEMM